MDFDNGRVFRVTKPGAYLVGMQPVAPYVQQGWKLLLEEGDMLTCLGTSKSFGDGVPIVNWAGADGKWLANDCEFHPSTGSMWNRKPDESYLEMVA